MMRCGLKKPISSNDSKEYVLSSQDLKDDNHSLSNENIHAQVLLEYIIIIGIVTIVLFAMYQMAKRGIQSIVKVTADQVGNQQSSDQVSGILIDTTGKGQSDNLSVRSVSSFLVSLNSTTNVNNQKKFLENTGTPVYSWDEGVLTSSNSLTDLGFTNRAD